jgi:hypothetical protein
VQCLHFNRGIYAFLAPQFGAFAYKSALSFSNTYRVCILYLNIKLHLIIEFRSMSEKNFSL